MMFYHSLWIILFGLAALTSTDAGSSQSPEGLIIAKILEKYERRARPIKNQKNPIQINIEIALHQVIELDELQQILYTKLWFIMRWQDEYLTWDSSEFDDIDLVTLDPDDIWTPDIMSYVSLNDEMPGYIFDEKVKIAVSSEGLVFWVPSAVLASSCTLDVTDYPFDYQKCMLKFGTWTTTINQVNISLSLPVLDLEVRDFLNGEWEIKESPCSTYSMDYIGNTYSVVQCHVNMERRAMFYVFNLGLPIVLLLLIGAMVFCLPPDSGDKINLSVTAFLALTVFIMVIMENLPSTSLAIPLMAKFIAACTVLLALSTGMSVIVVSIYNKFDDDESRPPYWVEKVFLGKFASLMGIHVPKRSDNNVELKQISASNHAGDGDSLMGKGEVSPGSKTLGQSPWMLFARVIDRMFAILYILCSIGLLIFIVVHWTLGNDRRQSE